MKASRELSLEEYIESLRQVVNDFEEEYRQKHESDKQAYPGSMNEADWDEQFVITLQGDLN